MIIKYTVCIKKCDQERKLYCNINEAENTLLQSQISAERNKMRSESILMRTEKAGGQARRKLRPNVTFLQSEQASEGERNRTTRKKS